MRELTIRRSVSFGIALVAVLPLAIVAAWSVLETHVEADLRRQVSAAAAEVADGAPLTTSAAAHGVWIRVFDASGQVLEEADATDSRDRIHDMSSQVFGDDDAPSLRRFDASLGPLPTRSELLGLGAGSAVECRSSAGAKVLFCGAARRVSGAQERWVFAAQTTRRAARGLYELRTPMIRLSVFTGLAALLLAWWLGRAIVRPIERLKQQALAKALSSNPHGGLGVVTRAGEVGELAGAFDSLLAKLEDARSANQRFVQDMVHELKNPLAAVRAVGESLERSPDPDERSARLARVLRDSTCDWIAW